MKIYINGYEVDMTLEGEKNLSDVIKSISEWARQRNLIFSQFDVDGEVYGIDSFLDRPSAEVRSLNCMIQSKSDLIISTLSEGSAYCERMLSFIDEAEGKGSFALVEAEAFRRGIEWLVDCLNSIFQLLSLDPSEIRYLDRSVREYLESLKLSGADMALIKTDSDALAVALKTRPLVDIVRGVFRMLFLSDSLKTIIIQSLESPDELIRSLSEIRDDIAAQEESLGAASAAFQAGKDAEGAEKLQAFTDFVYRYVRVCHQILPVFGLDPSEIKHGEMTLETMNANIHSYLGDIVSAMENGDIVTLSDILEYEIQPQFSAIREFVNIMLEKLGQ